MPQVKRHTPRAQECSDRRPRKRGLTKKQARRAKVSGGHVRQATEEYGRWVRGGKRPGGLTFELSQQEGRRKADLPSSIVRKTPSFPDGFAPGLLAGWIPWEHGYG